jgi:hypothetical protein
MFDNPLRLPPLGTVGSHVDVYEIFIDTDTATVEMFGAFGHVSDFEGFKAVDSDVGGKSFGVL